VVAGDDGLPLVVIAGSTDEGLAAIARRQRDEALRATDRTQLPDVPGATKARYVDYRQALRDVPQQPGFPRDINWPVPPGQ